MQNSNNFYVRHVHGDKEVFHLAWRKLGLNYAMPSRGIDPLPGVVCQHDFDGKQLFSARIEDGAGQVFRTSPGPSGICQQRSDVPEDNPGAGKIVYVSNETLDFVDIHAPKYGVGLANLKAVERPCRLALPEETSTSHLQV